MLWGKCGESLFWCISLIFYIYFFSVISIFDIKTSFSERAHIKMMKKKSLCFNPTLGRSIWQLNPHTSLYLHFPAPTCLYCSILDHLGSLMCLQIMFWKEKRKNTELNVFWKFCNFKNFIIIVCSIWWDCGCHIIKFGLTVLTKRGSRFCNWSEFG